MDLIKMKAIKCGLEWGTKDIQKRRQTSTNWVSGSKECARNACAAVKMKLMNRIIIQIKD
jgi:hypothetical protein